MSQRQLWCQNSKINKGLLGDNNEKVFNCHNWHQRISLATSLVFNNTINKIKIDDLHYYSKDELNHEQLRERGLLTLVGTVSTSSLAGHQ